MFHFLLYLTRVGNPNMLNGSLLLWMMLLPVASLPLHAFNFPSHFFVFNTIGGVFVCASLVSSNSYTKSITAFFNGGDSGRCTWAVVFTVENWVWGTLRFVFLLFQSVLTWLQSFYYVCHCIISKWIPSLMTFFFFCRYLSQHSTSSNNSCFGGSGLIIRVLAIGLLWFFFRIGFHGPFGVVICWNPFFTLSQLVLLLSSWFMSGVYSSVWFSIQFWI